MQQMGRNTEEISKCEYVTNGLWEGDPDTPLVGFLPCAREAILQYVYCPCITAPWHFISFYFNSY